MTDTPGRELAERVERLTGLPVTAFASIPGAGGYTQALRKIATLADGSTVFVKAAVDADTSRWMQAECAAYQALAGLSFMAGYIGGDDQVLVLEDLRHGRWPPPWGRQDVDRVLATLEVVGSVGAPPSAPAFGDATKVAGGRVGDLHLLWHRVGEDPEPLLRLGVCSAQWLDNSVDVLALAAAEAQLAGESVVHFDVRSDNLCLLPDRVVLVDWNLLCRGNPAIDAVFFAQTVTMEGGPNPWELLPEVDPRLVAVAAGFFADRAPGPPLPHAPSVREMQLAQLRVCLTWVARAFDLSCPK